MRLASYALAAAAGIAITGAGIYIGVAGFKDTASNARAESEAMIATSLREYDLARLGRLLSGGWDPNEAVDGERNSAIHFVVKACERDGGHDRARMLAVVQKLYDSGNRLDARNARGETPYGIALNGRACGPRHPVTEMIRRQCFEGFRPAGDACLSAGMAAPGNAGSPSSPDDAEAAIDSNST